MMPLWRLEMRPYGLSWPIYMTCDDVMAAVKPKGQK